MSAREVREALKVIARADGTTMTEAYAEIEAELACKRLQRVRLQHEIDRRHALAALDVMFERVSCERFPT